MFFSLPQLSPSLLIFCLNLLHLSLSFSLLPLLLIHSSLTGWRGGRRRRRQLSLSGGGKQLCQEAAAAGGAASGGVASLCRRAAAAASGCGGGGVGRRWWRLGRHCGREAAELPSASRPCPRREGGAPGPGQRQRGGTERRARPAGALKKEISFFFCYSLLR